MPRTRSYTLRSIEGEEILKRVKQISPICKASEFGSSRLSYLLRPTISLFVMLHQTAKEMLVLQITDWRYSLQSSGEYHRSYYCSLCKCNIEPVFFHPMLLPCTKLQLRKLVHGSQTPRACYTLESR